MIGRVVADFGGVFIGGELTRGQKSVIIEPSESGGIDEERIRGTLHQAHNSKAGFCRMLTDFFPAVQPSSAGYRWCSGG